jgi:O-antigen/teichoic acid export membrane protein
MQSIRENISIFFKKYGEKMGLDLPYFVRNSFWVFFQQTIGSISGLLLLMAFARLVDKDVFGQYQLAISIIVFTSIFAIPGLNIAIARSVAKGNDGDYPKAVRKSFYWAICGIPILIVVGLYYYFFRQNHTMGIALILVSWIFPFIYAPNTWNGFFLGKHKFRSSAILSSLQTIILFIATGLVIVLFKNNLVLLVGTYCLIYAMTNGIYYLRSLKFVTSQKSDPGTIRYGYFLSFTNSLEVLSEHIDKIIIGVLLSPLHLAIFTIISTLPLKFRNIIKPFFNIFFPKLTSEEINLKNIFLAKRNAIVILIAFIIFGGIVYFFTAEFISHLLFGEKYSDYYYFSRYFTLYIILNIPLLFLTKYIHAKKLSRTIFVTSPIFIVVKTILIIFGSYYWGLKGAIIAFNLGFVIKFMLSVIFLYFEKEGKKIEVLKIK